MEGGIEVTQTTTLAVAVSASASSALKDGEANTDAAADALAANAKSESARKAAAGLLPDLKPDFDYSRSRDTNVSVDEDDIDFGNDSSQQGDGYPSAVAEEDGKPRRSNNNDCGLHDDLAGYLMKIRGRGESRKCPLRTTSSAKASETETMVPVPMVSMGAAVLPLVPPFRS